MQNTCTETTSSIDRPAASTGGIDAVHRRVGFLFRISRRLPGFRIHPYVPGKVESMAHQNASLKGDVRRSADRGFTTYFRSAA